MKNKLLYINLVSLSFLLTACPFSLGDNGEWKKKYGTPELILENSWVNNVYLYNDQSYFHDEENVIREALKQAAPYEKASKRSVPKDMRYFTYEGVWKAATTGPNYEHLSVWENGYVRTDHKSSLGPHEYLYFSISEEKATYLVDLVFSISETNNTTK